MKKFLPLLVGLVLSPMLQAEDLVTVYKQARATNPDLQSYKAQRDMAYESISESRASLLPQLGLNASYTYGSGYRYDKGTHSKKGNLSLSLSQSLFNYSAWKALDITEKQASVQDISYQAQEQNLILNVAVAYFDVLSALDNLEYTQAQKSAIYRQLDETRQKHKVGLVAITDVQNAQANYDLTQAELVSAVNNLDNKLEALRLVSGNFYESLAIVNTKKFKTHNPENITKLLNMAKNNNLQLLSSRLALDLSKEQIRLAQAGHLPVLSLNASTSLAKTESYKTDLTGPAYDKEYLNRFNGQNSVAVTLTVPLYSGGATSSKVKQAQYNYVNYSQQLESSHRSVTNSVRSYYNNIVASKSAITAYEQAVRSAQGSLNATEAGYRVGTRTIVDVLNSTTQLYNSLKNLSNARYNYLINVLQLKAAIGTLTEDDLIALNDMLGAEKNITQHLTIKF